MPSHYPEISETWALDCAFWPKVCKKSPKLAFC